MKFEILGNKEYFGIEYSFQNFDDKTGYAKIWFGGNSIGTSEDLIFFNSYLIGGLENIYNSKYLNYEKSLSKNREELYDELVKNMVLDDEELNSYKYHINLGTFTDDYTIFSFSNKNTISIIWKLNDNSFFNDLKLLDKKVHSYQINKNDFKILLDSLKKVIFQND